MSDLIKSVGDSLRDMTDQQAVADAQAEQQSEHELERQVKRHDGLRIHEVRASNVKRLVTAHVQFNGKSTTISGRNRQGKSSLLDAIVYALGGAKVQPPNPIRDGEEEATVDVDLGEVRVVWTKRRGKGDRLQLLTPDGAAFPRPRERLSEWLSDLSFDPSDFLRAKPAQQVETLRRIAGLDTTDVDEREAAAFAKRTDSNRRVRDVEGQLRAIPEDPDAPTEEVGIGDLARILQTAMDARTARDKASTTVATFEQQIAAAEARLETLRAQVVAARDAAAKADVAVNDAGDPDVIRAQMNDIDSTNKRARKAAERRRVAAQLAAQLAEADRLDAEVAAARDERAARIAAVQMPLPDLSIGDSGVLWQGHPFEQASQAERIRVACAIGMKLNPRARFLMIREGSLMDDLTMAELQRFAEEHDFQVIIERVAAPNEAHGIVLEEGRVIRGGVESEQTEEAHAGST